MKPLILVFAVAVALYLPTVRYGFVLDDQHIVLQNPAAHSPLAALRAVDEPYWPRPSPAGLYRPLTILSFGVDWALSGGRAWWFHLVNALWHGLAAVLVVLVVARWLPGAGAVAAGLAFAVHPVHVEAVAGLVGRAELLAAVGILGTVVAARRHWWLAALGCATLALFSKETGVITGGLVLLDDLLHGPTARRHPQAFYAGLAALTLGFVAMWLTVGRPGSGNVAPPFLGTGTAERLAMALPAIWRAATLLVWPAALSADYDPQVLPVRTGVSVHAILGALIVLAVPLLAWWSRRRAPALSFAAGAATLTYLPSANLLFPAGVVLAERCLYVPVLLVAAGFGYAVEWCAQRWDRRGATVVIAVLVLALAARSFVRLPAWESNKTFIVTLREEHPESFRAHWWSSIVFSRMGDTASARRALAQADSLFPGYPNLEAWRAMFLLGVADTVGVGPMVERARRAQPRQPIAMRAQFLLELERGHRAQASALADTAIVWFPGDRDWYRSALEEP